MCLDKVDKVTKKGRGYGYKSFNQTEEGLSPICKNKGLIFKEEEWIEDTSSLTILTIDQSYPTGFHINTSKKGVLGWRCGCIYRKVLYKDVVASGKQARRNIIVARKIYICKGEC